MGERDEEQRQRFPLAAWLIGTMLFLAALYVLSFGVFVALETRSYISKQAAQRIDPIYAPIHFLQRRSPMFRRVVNWYYDVVSG
jgi:hypothetical protein